MSLARSDTGSAPGAAGGNGIPTIRRLLASWAIVTLLVLQLDWVTGATAHGAQVGPARLLAAAAAGAAVYGLVSAIALLAALALGAVVRSRIPALGEMATARAIAGGLLLVFVFHGLDKSWGFEPGWIPIAVGVALGLRAFEPSFGATLAMGAFVIGCVTLVASQAELPGTQLHVLWGVIIALGILVGVPWEHAAARWRIPAALVVSALTLVTGFALGRPVSPTAVAGAGAAQKPNLVLVTVDTLRADALGAYGGPADQTPILDREAKRGTLFLHAYSPGPWTLPSLAAIFAARPAGEIRRGPYTYAPDSSWIPLVTRLGERGYRSLAVVSNPSLIPLTKGFDEVRVLHYDLSGHPLGILPLLGHLHSRLELSRGRLPLIDTTHAIRESALGFLARSGESPFFLWLHVLDPHDPYNPPAEWRSPTPAGQRSFFAPQSDVGDPSVIDLQNGRTVGLDDAFWSHLRSLYAAEVRYVDASLGKILETLESRGLASNTLVVITGDHGEEFLEHGSYYHGQSLYNELLHVPLLFVGPGVRADRVVPDRVGTIDIVPTLEAYLGLDADPAHRQRSLLPYLTGEGPPPGPRDLIAEGTNHGEPRRALLAGNYKLILHTLTRRTELYDLVADPQERRDLAPQRPDLVASLLTRLDSITARRDVSQPTQDDAEEVGRLRALGYVQ